MVSKYIIGRLKKIREEKGMSRYRLSQLTGIHQSTLKRYEDGEIQKINFENFFKICEALEIDVEEIL